MICISPKKIKHLLFKCKKKWILKKPTYLQCFAVAILKHQYSMPRLHGVVTGVIAGRGVTMGRNATNVGCTGGDTDDEDVLLYWLGFTFSLGHTYFWQ